MAGATKYDVLTPVEWAKGNDKGTRWTRVGAAWRTDKGGLSIVLDALPVNGRLIVKKSEERPERSGGRAAPEPDDDDIPF